jgi:hypothetical protein
VKPEEISSCIIATKSKRTGGKPEIITPRRHQARPPRQRRIPAHNLLGRLPIHNEILQLLARNGDINSRGALRLELQTDLAGIVHKHTVPLRADVKRDILVRQFRRGPAVLVPDIDALPVLDEGPEALPEPIQLLAHAEVQLGEHVPLALEEDAVVPA